MAFDANKEQLQFLESKNCNVLVSASAGSGKTSTMIQKLMQIIINDRIPIQRLLVLTFTDSAANEIKQRLFAEISLKMQKASKEDLNYLKVQLENINSAEIGTLHSVCKKLIIKYFYEINESPDFSMLSDKESKYLIDLSMSNVFEKHVSSADDRFFELYDSYNYKRNDKKLKNIFMILLNYLRNKCDYSRWIEDTLNSVFNENLKENVVCLYLHKYCVDNIKTYLLELDNLITECGVKGFNKYLDFLLLRKSNISEMAESKDMVQLSKIIFSLPSIKKPTKAKNADVDELDFDERLDALNKSISITVKEIKELLFSNDESVLTSNLMSTKDMVTFVLSIVEEINNNYIELKKKKNVLDFNDLEDKMLNLLDNSNLQKILQKNYAYIFFDEYQDINEKQEKILTKLVSKDNYYMIGDVKQSIYAFRQSSPKIFVNKFYKFNNDGVENKVINFNKNYRSDRNILEFCNIVFDKLITENTIGIDYAKNSRFESNKETFGCNVSLNVFCKGQEEDISDEQKEALIVANSIVKCLGEKKADGTNYTYKDIAIILRKRGTYLKTLCDTLMAMQIPICAVVANDFFASFEVNLLKDIVSVVCNYQNDISLSSVLKNLFKISDEELYDIKCSFDDKNFYNCVLNYPKNNETKQKIEKFFEFLNNSNLYLFKNTIRDYLQKVLDDFDIIPTLKSMPNGMEKVNNVEEFLTLADNNNYKYNIEKFVEYLDFISTEPQLQKVGAVGNAVQIMTIHYSKGLEFPAVILAGLGKKFNLNKDTSEIIISEKFGLGLKRIDNNNRTLEETLIRNACKIDNKRSELNEEIRLLYVAMTRPKEKLILIGNYDLDNFEKNKYKDIYQSSNYLDMIFKCIPDVYNSNFINKKDFVLNEGEPSQAIVNFVNDEIKLDGLNEEKLAIITEPDEKLFETFENSIGKTPDTKVFTIKNTVTNILNEEKDYENINICPKKLDISDNNINKDYLKLGTAYHSVMQNLNFAENKPEIEDLIKRLISENIIDKDVASDIKLDEIYTAKENLKNLIGSAKKVYREKQFIMQENYNKIVKNSDNNTKVIVQGVIDLALVYENDACLIDYKTNKIKDEQSLIDMYALQINIYALAFEKATNIQVKHKYLYSFYLNKLIEIK